MIIGVIPGITLLLLGKWGFFGSSRCMVECFQTKVKKRLRANKISVLIMIMRHQNLTCTFQKKATLNSTMDRNLLIIGETITTLSVQGFTVPYPLDLITTIRMAIQKKRQFIRWMNSRIN